MATVIQAMQRPPGHVAQQDAGRTALSEFKEFFPNNAVHYFVSYDYYQPEAYISCSRDIYIEKDAAINEEIDLRLPPPALAEPPRRVIIVAVSSIYAGWGP